jgi:Repeat of unknown function (DUF5650)
MKSLSHLFHLYLAASLLAGLPFIAQPLPTAQGALQIDLHGPAGSVVFGTRVVALPNGNIVVTDPEYSVDSKAKVGAVYLYNGRTRALISMLTGSTVNDQVGISQYDRPSIVVLANGNYVVDSPYWNSSAATKVGAVTWCSGITGCGGVISSSNSLVGGTANDQVGYCGVTALTNGNYVVCSDTWNDGVATEAGAATWGNGATGITGVVTITNSLVGTTAYDELGNSIFCGVTALANGNYVVCSPYWDNGAVVNAGAATWGNGATGITGVVTITNSLVGGTAGDSVGFPGVTALTNGNYVVVSPEWHNGAVFAGATTWGNGATGITGVVTITNSLVGGTAGDGSFGTGVRALTNGNYVVSSGRWSNGAVVSAGAVTWGNGTTGITGEITAANSLVGSTADDEVGAGGVRALTNGNYVVSSYVWNNGVVTQTGAVTWGNGATGITGVVTTTNSLVGSLAGDQVGDCGVTTLTNGNYVVCSYGWNNGAATWAGAATWGNGATGITGVVTATNSLVGTTAGDRVSYCGITALTNGNYVVCSDAWNNGGGPWMGAATWGNGASGVTGTVSAANSLVGSDAVGAGGVWALTNGNYVVVSSEWHNSAMAGAGAVTWGDGATGLTGTVSITNSLVGSSANDQIGYGSVTGGITALANGNYVVISPEWHNGAMAGAGAVTLGDGLGVR